MTKPAVSIITPIRATNDQHVKWLRDAVGSVVAQSVDDWEMVIVDDHSTVQLPRYDGAVKVLQATGNGASAARNQAAEAAKADLLLPLDADDQFAPIALEMFLKAWESRGDAGIIYSDIVMFGQDFARVYLAPEYSFRTLLQATFMLVGSLHSKADWKRVGGWREDMEGGLEDWEYWLAMGEMGVCGKRVPEPLYWYRRRPGGRLAALKADPTRWHKAYQKMRALHVDSYNGRFTMCCGDAVQSVPARAPTTARPQITGDRVPVAYVGPRQGDFWVTGPVSRVKYHIMGRGEFLTDDLGHLGVDRRDVKPLTSMNRGKNFKVISQPAPAPAPAKPIPRAAPETSEAWKPTAMEGQRTVGMGEPHPQTASVPPGDLTLKQLRALKDELTPKDALWMLEKELVGKNRVGAIRFLEKIASGS